MTQQTLFGGDWTQRKLEVLKRYLQAYTRIFQANQRARFYTISYVDAFAGTGTLPRRTFSGLPELLPQLIQNEEEFRKGSVRRALEVVPPFHKYVFIEKSRRKCKELSQITNGFPNRHVRIAQEDANVALSKWCANLDSKRERAVVFLDPFGASVDWSSVAALARTRAVDLWVLFPHSAINRMLVRRSKPPKSWAKRLTSVFGTTDWESEFYSTMSLPSLLDSQQPIELVHKSADHKIISDFYVKRLGREFEAVSNPFPMRNSNGSLLFILFFAAANRHSAETGLKIANDIIGKELDLD